MSMQFAFGFNPQTAIAESMISADILESAKNEATWNDSPVEFNTRSFTAYCILSNWLRERDEADIPVIDEIRRRYPDAADEAEHDHYEWVHDL